MATQPAFEVPYWPHKITKYAKNRLMGMNMSEAAREAGYSDALINQAGARIEPKAELRIKEALNAAGATNDVLADVIVAGLTARKSVVVDKQVVEVDDLRERREYAKLCLEAKGELKTGSTVAVQINFPAGLAEMLAKDAEEYQR